MADVLVKGATVSGGRISKLKVELHGIGERTLDRDATIAWMRDGHSLIPFAGGSRGTALQLVEVGDEAELFVRTDNAQTAEDALPELPSA